MSYLIIVCMDFIIEFLVCGDKVEGFVLWMINKELGSYFFRLLRKLFLGCYLVVEIVFVKLLV